VDRGKAFESTLFKDTLKRFKAEIIYSSPYHHNTIGIIVREFRTIRDAINIRIKDHVHKDWTEILSEVEFMMTSTSQATTGISPADMIFGRKLRHWWKDTKKQSCNKKEKSENMIKTKRIFHTGDKVLIKKENAKKEDDRYMGTALVKSRRRHTRFLPVSWARRCV